MTDYEGRLERWKAGQERRKGYLARAIPDVQVPAGEAGLWKVETYEVGDPSPTALVRAQLRMERIVPPGRYTRLIHMTRGVVMSDTPDEKDDHRGFVRRAHGHVLIAGLGLGMCLRAILNKPEVTWVTVLEMEQDVIDLVGPSFAGERVTIIQADALEWRPEAHRRWDVAWFDIWDEISHDNLPDMQRLHRRYGRKAAWKGSWGRDIIEYDRRHG